jgi:hypothetical protein
MSPMQVRLTLSRYAARRRFRDRPGDRAGKPTVGNLRGSLVWGPDARECFRCERTEDAPRLRTASCS